MIVYGRNPVREALRGRRRVSRVWATESAAAEPWLRDVEVAVAPAGEIERLCGSPEHQGICADAGDYPYADAGSLLGPEDALVICLDQVQDPHNLGAVARVAEAAGASGLVVPERRAAAVTPAAAKASAGAVEHLPIARVRNLADWLASAKEAGAWVYGADAGGDRALRPARLPRAAWCWFWAPRGAACVHAWPPPATRWWPCPCAGGWGRSTWPPRRPPWCTASCTCARPLTGLHNSHMLPRRSG